MSLFGWLNSARQHQDSHIPANVRLVSHGHPDSVRDFMVRISREEQALVDQSLPLAVLRNINFNLSAAEQRHNPLDFNRRMFVFRSEHGLDLIFPFTILGRAEREGVDAELFCLAHEQRFIESQDGPIGARLTRDGVQWLRARFLTGAIDRAREAQGITTSGFVICALLAHVGGWKGVVEQFDMVESNAYEIGLVKNHPAEDLSCGGNAEQAMHSIRMYAQTVLDRCGLVSSPETVFRIIADAAGLGCSDHGRFLVLHQKATSPFCSYKELVLSFHQNGHRVNAEWLKTSELAYLLSNRPGSSSF